MKGVKGAIKYTIGIHVLVFLSILLWTFLGSKRASQAEKTEEPRVVDSPDPLEESNTLLAQAKSLLKEGDRKSAKPLLEKAASVGNAEAYFLLSYNYVNRDHEKHTQQYEQASLLGHKEAFRLAIRGRLRFNPASPKSFNPARALGVYRKCKDLYPEFKLYNETNTVKTIERCAEIVAALGPFEWKFFLKEHEINYESENYGPFPIWKFAEEASRGGRFGKPDMNLTLQLIIREPHCSPNALEYAVKENYELWKAGEPLNFNLCHYVTSGLGSSYCSRRHYDKKMERLKNEIDDIISDRPLKHKEALTQYREKYEEFIFAKAWHEEGHGGTGAAGFACLSVEEKKEVRHELIKEILAGKIPEIKDSHESADKRLNDIYQKVIMRLKQSPYRVGRSNCTDLVLRKTQRLWIDYRDATAASFSLLVANTDTTFWKSWMTLKRIDQLENFLERIDDNTGVSWN